MKHDKLPYIEQLFIEKVIQKKTLKFLENKYGISRERIKRNVSYYAKYLLDEEHKRLQDELFEFDPDNPNSNIK